MTAYINYKSSGGESRSNRTYKHEPVGVNWESVHSVECDGSELEFALQITGRVIPYNWNRFIFIGEDAKLIVANWR